MQLFPIIVMYLGHIPPHIIVHCLSNFFKLERKRISTLINFFPSHAYIHQYTSLTLHNNIIDLINLYTAHALNIN